MVGLNELGYIQCHPALVGGSEHFSGRENLVLTSRAHQPNIIYHQHIPSGDEGRYRDTLPTLEWPNISISVYL